MALAVSQAETRELPAETLALSDERIEELLREAETRLREKAGLQPVDAEDDILSLDTGATPKAFKQIRLPKLEHNLETSSYLINHNGIARNNAALTVPAEQRKMADGLRSLARGNNNKKMNDQTDAGAEWFNLPKTELTTALKRDLQLIEMRNVLDPHRHYKKSARKGKIPTFSQIGTVIEGATEWYSGRINKKERSKNFVEEVMRADQGTGRFKRKYNEIQTTKTSGKKAHYNKVMANRKHKT